MVYRYCIVGTKDGHITYVLPVDDGTFIDLEEAKRHFRGQTVSFTAPPETIGERHVIITEANGLVVVDNDLF